MGPASIASFGELGFEVEKYTTFPSPPEGDQTYCNYKQKSQLTAFLLQWFLGTVGAGRFYIEDYLLGGCQAGLIGFICCCACCGAVAASAGGEAAAIPGLCGGLSTVCSSASMTSWTAMAPSCIPGDDVLVL